MREMDLGVPPGCRADAIPRRIEEAIAAENLIVTQKSTLAHYPGCLHWHIKRGKERGVLEITWWEKENRLWFKIAAGRMADWIEATAAKLRALIEDTLRDLNETNI